MVGIVIVSHSKKVAEGIFELAVQMTGKDHRMIPVGRTERLEQMLCVSFRESRMQTMGMEW